MVNQRLKGQRGERLAFKLLNEELGTNIGRNLLQTKFGGADADQELCGFLIEVKFQQSLDLRSWWKQTLRQAVAKGAKPCLMYKQVYKPWKIVVRLHDLSPEAPVSDELEYTATLLKDGFCALIREKMNG